VFGKLEEFLSTSCITSLSFLDNTEEGDPDNLTTSVKEYLEKELQKPFARVPQSHKSTIRRKTSIYRARKSGISGIIKRTRSIQVDQYDSGMSELFCYFVFFLILLKIFGLSTLILELAHLRSEYEAKAAAHLLEDNDKNSSHETSEEKSSPLSPGAPDLEEDGFSNFGMNPEAEMRVKTMADPEATVEDLVTMFKETESLEEQADILHYLAYSQGLYWDTKISSNSVVTVKDLLKELYERACQEKKWALVRHIAGILGKKVEDLAKAVADLLVRQKQVTVGMPPHNEHTITRPLPSKEIRQLIHSAHGNDQSTAMLTQELLVYLAMYIRTEPQLFVEMLRLRVGLIIQVSASELGKALKCDGDEASEHLLNLSPYEMKMLLHHILSGQEFAVKGGKILA